MTERVVIGKVDYVKRMKEWNLVERGLQVALVCPGFC